MRVLYVNHTSRVSGAEHSLLQLLDGLPDAVDPVVACPDGPFAELVRERGVELRTVPGTEGSLKLHPWHTARALGELGAEALAVRRLCKRLGAEIVHANSIRAGMAVCTGVGAATPRVVQVRDCLPDGRASRLSLGVIDRRATLVLANSSFTEDCFARLAGRAPTGVLYSPVDLRQFDPNAVGREQSRAALGIDADAPVLAVVAQLTPWKGQDDAVRLTARLRERFPGVRLLLAGSAKFTSGATRHDNVTYVRGLERLVSSLGLDGQVSFLGERSDVREVLAAADVLLAPSWEEPFGRSVVEAMAMETPVVASREGGPSESLRAEVDGFLAPARRPDEWVEPTARLLDSSDLRARMGQSARQRAQELFDTRVIVTRLLEYYERLLS